MSKNKRGDRRGDGRVFWHYRADGSEYWVTEEKFKHNTRNHKIGPLCDRPSPEVRRILKNQKEKERAALNAASIRERKAKYYQDNKDHIRERQKKYEQENKDKIRERKSRYQAQKRNADPIQRLKDRIRNRVRKALGRGDSRTTKRTMEMIGCSWDHLRSHIESQFTGGMSWERFSEIHIDHIKPLSSASTCEEMLKLCHYTNLQPLWAADNLKKSNKIQ